MALALPDVTLCSVTAVNHQLTVRAMEECLRHCTFADAVLITDRPVAAPFRVELTPDLPDGAHYAPFVCKSLTKYTPSSFNLLVQYDGYVLDPSAWTNEFFDYDYIGAKWPWHKSNRRVGNSGFCLRSKKMLDVLSQIELPPIGTWVDDTFICYTIRDKLEQEYGLRVAPENIADQFAYERHEPDRPTFGFHGIFNFWRHTPDQEMEIIPFQFDDIYVASRGFVEVLLHYYTARKTKVFGSWYRRMRNYLGKEALEQHLRNFVDNPNFIAKLMNEGEKAAAGIEKSTKQAV